MAKRIRFQETHHNFVFSKLEHLDRYPIIQPCKCTEVNGFYGRIVKSMPSSLSVVPKMIAAMFLLAIPTGCQPYSGLVCVCVCVWVCVCVCYRTLFIDIDIQLRSNQLASMKETKTYELHLNTIIHGGGHLDPH